MHHFYTIYEKIKKNNNFNNSFFNKIIDHFNSLNREDDWIIMFYDF